jgi:hypothetical protein
VMRGTGSASILLVLYLETGDSDFVIHTHTLQYGLSHTYPIISPQGLRDISCSPRTARTAQTGRPCSTAPSPPHSDETQHRLGLLWLDERPRAVRGIDTVVRSAGEGVVVSLPLGGDDVLVLDLSACVLTRPTPLPYSSAESGQKGGSEKDSKIAVQQCRGGIHSRTGQCVVPFRSLNTWSFFSSSEGSMSERGQ